MFLLNVCDYIFGVLMDGKLFEDWSFEEIEIFFWILINFIFILKLCI